MRQNVFRKVMLVVTALAMNFPVWASTGKFGTSDFSYEDMDYKKNRFAIDLGIGGGQGSTGFDLGLRYQHNFAPFIGWDVLSAKVVFPTDDPFDESPDLQIMTGLRGTSPNFYKNMSAYLSVASGYGFSTDSGMYNNDGGVCAEIGVGVNLCKYVYMGYAFNFQKVNIDDLNVSGKGKVHYFRLGFVF